MNEQSVEPTKQKENKEMVNQLTESFAEAKEKMGLQETVLDKIIDCRISIDNLYNRTLNILLEFARKTPPLENYGDGMAESEKIAYKHLIETIKRFNDITEQYYAVKNDNAWKWYISEKKEKK